MSKRRWWNLRRIRGIANYQFQSKVGSTLFPDGVEIKYSKRTGRIRHIYFNGKLLATLRPREGLFSLTPLGAERLQTALEPLRCRVIVREEVEELIKKGRTVFARHVLKADPEIRPGHEVIVTNKMDNLLAVGKASMSGREMLAFKRGIAVKVRQGIGKGKAKCEK